LREKVILCWSGGKDCALTLHELRRNGEYEVKGFTGDDLVMGAVPANQAKVKELLSWAEASLVF